MKKSLGLLSVGILGIGAFTSIIASCGSAQTPKTPNKDKTIVDEIANKIKNKDLGYLTYTPNTDASKNTTNLNKLLTNVNKNLNENDLKYISYSGLLTPDGETHNQVNLLIKSNSYSKKIDIEVILSKSDKRMVDEIANKIESKSLIILISATTSQNAKDFKKTIDEALLNNNKSSLNDKDLINITYSGKLIIGNNNPIKANIKIGSELKVVDLQITWAKSDEQIANAIKDLMKVGQVLLEYTPKTDASTLQTEINKVLKQKNPLFTDDYLSKISYSGVITAGKDNPIVATIKVGTTTVIFKNYIISVKNSDAKISTIISKQIQKTDTYI